MTMSFVGDALGVSSNGLGMGEVADMMAELGACDDEIGPSIGLHD